MRFLVLLLLSALLVGSVATFPAWAATYRSSWTKLATPGVPVVAYQGDDVGDDCTALDVPTVEVVSPPRHGQTFAAQAKVLPHFPATNSHARCNDTLVDGIYLYYRSDPAFLGEDHLTVRSKGADRLFEVDVTIRVVRRNDL